MPSKASTEIIAEKTTELSPRRYKLLGKIYSGLNQAQKSERN
jgi:hypothetical protein